MKNSQFIQKTEQILRNCARWFTKALIVCGCDWVVQIFLNICKRGFKLYVSRASTIADYVKANPLDNSIKYVGSNPRQMIYCLPRYEADQKQMQTIDNYTGKYIAMLSNVIIIGGSNLVITCDGHGLNDMFANDRTHHMQFNGRAFKITIGNSKIVSIVPVADMSTIEKGIMLSANFSLNYYHFTMEILPRFEFIDQQVPLDVPLIVDSDIVKCKQFVEILNYFNQAKREIIVVPVHQTVKINKLFYPSIAPDIAPDIKKATSSSATDSLFDAEALDFVRKKMTTLNTYTSTAKKIFLYRPGGVRNFNQDEIFAALEPFGFTKVQTEKMNAAQQVALFSEAKIIIGGSGAALTNILYCNPNCKVYVIVKSDFKNITAFSTIAAHFGVELQYISAHLPRSTNPIDFHANFKIDPRAVVNLLSV